MLKMKRWFAWLSLTLFVIVLDQLTKAAVVDSYAFGEGVVITSFFNIIHVLNPGASFSFLAGAGGWQRWFFIALAGGVSVWLAFMLWQHKLEKLMPAALALILGGAVGNVIDRISIGAVVDFLDFHAGTIHFPAFNVADCAITLGVVLMLVDQLKTAREASHG